MKAHSQLLKGISLAKPNNIALRCSPNSRYRCPREDLQNIDLYSSRATHFGGSSIVITLATSSLRNVNYCDSSCHRSSTVSSHGDDDIIVIIGFGFAIFISKNVSKRDWWKSRHVFH